MFSRKIFYSKLKGGGKTTDTKLLREQVDKSGLKYPFIAENLDLSMFGLSMKVDGETEFKVSEIPNFGAKKFEMITGINTEELE